MAIIIQEDIFIQNIRNIKNIPVYLRVLFNLAPLPFAQHTI